MDRIHLSFQGGFTGKEGVILTGLESASVRHIIDYSNEYHQQLIDPVDSNSPQVTICYLCRSLFFKRSIYLPGVCYYFDPVQISMGALFFIEWNFI